VKAERDHPYSDASLSCVYYEDDRLAA
jgi:hypothetical protein